MPAQQPSIQKSTAARSTGEGETVKWRELHTCQPFHRLLRTTTAFSKNPYGLLHPSPPPFPPSYLLSSVPLLPSAFVVASYLLPPSVLARLRTSFSFPPVPIISEETYTHLSEIHSWSERRSLSPELSRNLAYLT